MIERELLLDICPLPKKPPYVIYHVSETQFSIARFYGSINFYGHAYIYNALTDELVREDVLKWLKSQA